MTATLALPDLDAAAAIPALSSALGGPSMCPERRGCPATAR
ncbi:hypothetical protein [Paracoccus marcusii]